MAQLAVYVCSDYVGMLSCDNRQRFWFQYDPEWIARKDLPPLSLSMPLREEVGCIQAGEACGICIGGGVQTLLIGSSFSSGDLLAAGD